MKPRTYFVMVDYNMPFVVARNLTLPQAQARAQDQLNRRKTMWKRGARPRVLVCAVKEVLA